MNAVPLVVGSLGRLWFRVPPTPHSLRSGCYHGTTRTKSAVHHILNIENTLSCDCEVQTFARVQSFSNISICAVTSPRRLFRGFRILRPASRALSTILSRDRLVSNYAGMNIIPGGTDTIPARTMSVQAGTTTIPRGTTCFSAGIHPVPAGTTVIPHGTGTVPPRTASFSLGTTIIPRGTSTIQAGTLSIPVEKVFRQTRRRAVHME